MITARMLYDHFGPPENETSMVLFKVPTAIDIQTLPRKIYCNKNLVKPLELAFQLIHDRNLGHLILTYDGCFNIRKKQSSSSMSLHAWGYAIDINAAWNRFGKPPTMPPLIVECFKEAGFDWGGTWLTPDGMHFQLREL